MKVGDDFVQTKVINGEFQISISEESDYSSDGGYSFESTTNTWELDVSTALELLNELKVYLGH